MIEMEAKIQVNSFIPIRCHLHRLSANCIGSFLCFERYFDTPDKTLQKEGKSLRLRWSHNNSEDTDQYILTVKGSLLEGALKTRNEHEIEFNEHPQDAVKLLSLLGYKQTLAFDKLRETWQAGNCKVELDEISEIGKFVEIEGPSEAEIMELRGKLSLQNSPLILQGYASMVADYRASQCVKESHV